MFIVHLILHCGNIKKFFIYVNYRSGSEITPQKQLKEEAETIMQRMLTSVQYTAVSISGHCNAFASFYFVIKNLGNRL